MLTLLDVDDACRSRIARASYHEARMHETHVIFPVTMNWYNDCANLTSASARLTWLWLANRANHRAAADAAWRRAQILMTASFARRDRLISSFLGETDDSATFVGDWFAPRRSTWISRIIRELFGVLRSDFSEEFDRAAWRLASGRGPPTRLADPRAHRACGATPLAERSDVYGYFQASARLFPWRVF